MKAGKKRSETGIHFFREKKEREKKITACSLRDISGVRDESVIKALLVSGAEKKEIEAACRSLRGGEHCVRDWARPLSRGARKAQMILDIDGFFLD